MPELTQLEKVIAWNDRWNKGRAVHSYIPVAYNPNPEETDPDYVERNITTAYGLAYLSPEKDGERLALVRLTDYAPFRSGARLDHLEVLDGVLAKILDMKKVDGDEAVHRNPECPDCNQEMAWDDGFDCSICLTHYCDDGSFSHRLCVEYDCDEWAEVVGDDEQPRCIPCQTLVLSDELSPNSPYECSKCRVLVVGIPAKAAASKNRLCRSHQGAKEHNDFIDEILSRRS